jgi:dolichol kinase
VTGAGQQYLRNAIHLGTGLAAPAVLAWPKPWALALTGSMLAVALTADAVRLRPDARTALDRRLPGVFRPNETGRPSGASLLAAGYLAAVLFLPAEAAAAGILALAVGDPAAAVVGRWYGTRAEVTGKTWAGSLACFLGAAGAMWCLPSLGASAAVAGGAMAALVERRAGPLDNVVLPLLTGLLVSLWLP